MSEAAADVPRLSFAAQFPDGSTVEEGLQFVASSVIAKYVQTGKYLKDTKFQPVRFFVDKILPEGYGLIIGSPKIGKSFLVLDFALGICEGTEVLNGGNSFTGVPVDGAPVLYLALEDSARRMKERILLLRGRIPENFEFVTEIESAKILLLMEAWLSLHPQGVIFLDTLGKYERDRRASEQAYDKDYRVGGEFKKLIAKYPGSCIAAVHHTRKGVSEDWMESTSGTNGLNGSADFTLLLSRDRGSAEGVLRATGRDHKEEVELALTYEGGQWGLFGGDYDAATEHSTEVVAGLGVGSSTKNILHVVAEHPEGVSPKEVVVALGGGAVYGTVQQSMSRLAKKNGKLRKDSRGRYFLANTITPVDEAEVLDDNNTEED